MSTVVTTPKSTTISTVKDLLDLSMEFDNHKADYKVKAKSLEFDASSLLLIPPTEFGAVQPLEPTDWAWRQMFAKLGPAVYGDGSNRTLPADYLLAIDPSLRSVVLNDHLQGFDKEWNVLTYDGSCRGVVSGGRYAVIRNTELLEILDEVAGEFNENSGHPYGIARDTVVRADDMNVKVIWKEINKPNGGRDGDKPGRWGIGTYIGNGEIGNKKIRIKSLVKRTSCDNSIIGTDDGSFESAHIGSPAALRTLVKSAISQALPFAAELLERMIKAEEKKIPNIADLLYVLGEEYDWDDGTKNRVGIGTEGSQTLAGVVNGMTFAAHEIQDPNVRVDFETLAGAILVDADSVFSRAMRSVERIQR